MKQIWLRFQLEESGQDLIEYALLGSFIALASVAGLVMLGPTVANFYEQLNALFQSL